MTFSPRRPVPTRRINGPADLVQAIPYLLGFHPHDSLVLVGLAEGRLVVTARMDLADLAEPELLRHTLAALCRGGTQTVVAAVYDESPQSGPPPWHGLADALAEECRTAGCELTEVLRVARGRWWSYLCTDPTCCPPEGTAIPDAPSAFVAEATVAGTVAMADRAARAATLEPLPEADRNALLPLIAEHERRAAAAVVAGAADEHDGACVAELFALARRGEQAAQLNDADVARFGVALRAVAVRDELWREIDARRVDGRAVWRELSRRLPDHWAAAPLFLFGWASWRDGQGAMANVAAERTVRADAEYTAADLLTTLLARAIDPRTFPPLGSGEGPPRGRPGRARVRGRPRRPAA